MSADSVVNVLSRAEPRPMASMTILSLTTGFLLPYVISSLFELGFSLQGRKFMESIAEIWYIGLLTGFIVWANISMMIEKSRTPDVHAAMVACSGLLGQFAFIHAFMRLEHYSDHYMTFVTLSAIMGAFLLSHATVLWIEKEEFLAEWEVPAEPEDTATIEEHLNQNNRKDPNHVTFDANGRVDSPSERSIQHHDDDAVVVHRANGVYEFA